MDDDPRALEGIAEYLTGLSRQSLATGRAADLTCEYLEAGVDLIASALDHDPETGVHPFLQWLSQRRVVEAVNVRGNLRAADGTLRDRWQPHARYLGDLVTWIRLRRPARSFPVRERDRVSAAFATNATVSQLVRGLCREVQTGIVTNPLFRLQLLAVSVLGSPRYRESEEYGQAAPELYEELDKRWLPVLHAFLDRNEVELRPGVEPRDLVELVTAVGEGIALRELADPTEGSRRARRMSLQGTAALALIAAFVDRGDGMNLDEYLDSI